MPSNSCNYMHQINCQLFEIFSFDIFLFRNFFFRELIFSGFLLSRTHSFEIFAFENSFFRDMNFSSIQFFGILSFEIFSFEIFSSRFFFRDFETIPISLLHIIMSAYRWLKKVFGFNQTTEQSKNTQFLLFSLTYRKQQVHEKNFCF